MLKVIAFRLGLAICIQSAEPGLQHEPRKSLARSRYGCNAGDGVFFFVVVFLFCFLFFFGVLMKIQDV